MCRKPLSHSGDFRISLLRCNVVFNFFYFFLLCLTFIVLVKFYSVATITLW